MGQPSIALCGAGMISGAHALAAASLGVPVVAVASRTADRARERAQQIDSSTRAVEYRELPAGADIVVVATPPALHEAHTLAALERRAAVLLEKPLATTLAEADRLVENQGIMLYAENLAFAPIFREFLARARTVGPLTHLELRTLQSRPTWGDFLSPHWGGGVLFDLGVHPLALAVLIARTTGRGEVVEVNAWLSGDDTDTRSDVTLRFDSGLRARIVASWDGPEAGVWDVQASSETGVVRAELRPDLRLEVNGDEVSLPAPNHPVPFIEQFGYVEQLRTLIECWKTGERPSCDAVFGRWMLEIVAACYVSASRDGAAVSVPSGCDRTRTPWQLWRGS